jgi:putative transcriptional regulator
MGKGSLRIKPANVKSARAAAVLTQAEAAQLVYNSIDNWQNWEQGRHPMPPGLYELFLLKTDQLAVGESFVLLNKAPSRDGSGFGCRILMLRKAKNLTQSALASLVGSTKQCVCNWEAGKYGAPRASTAARLCEVFDVSLNYILQGVD